MKVILSLIIAAASGYFLGSCNFSIIVVKLLKGKDIRDMGSRNAGLTNTLRCAGKTCAILTLLGDILKGVVAVAIARGFCGLLSAGMNPGNDTHYIGCETDSRKGTFYGENYLCFCAFRLCGDRGSGLYRVRSSSDRFSDGRRPCDSRSDRRFSRSCAAASSCEQRRCNGWIVCTDACIRCDPRCIERETADIRRDTSGRILHSDRNHGNCGLSRCFFADTADCDGIFAGSAERHHEYHSAFYGSYDFFPCD